MPTIQRSDLIYPELSYALVGVLFEVHKHLGSGYQEKYYQRAIAVELKNNNFSFREQVSLPLSYKEQAIGRYFVDLLLKKK